MDEDLEKSLLSAVEEWDKETAKSKGLGDTIAKLAKAFDTKSYGGCQRRREKLNKLFPYVKS